MNYAEDMDRLIGTGQLDSSCESDYEFAKLESNPVHQLNRCINENLRAARMGHPLPHCFSDLHEMHAQLGGRHCAKNLCVFCLAINNTMFFLYMSDEFIQIMEQRGYRPLLKFSPAELEQGPQSQRPWDA